MTDYEFAKGVKSDARLILKSSVCSVGVLSPPPWDPADPVVQAIVDANTLAYDAFSAVFMGKKSKIVTVGFSTSGSLDHDTTLPEFRVYDVNDNQLTNARNGPVIPANIELELAVGSWSTRRPFAAVTTADLTDPNNIPVTVKLYNVNNPTQVVSSYALGSYDPAFPLVYESGYNYAGNFSEPDSKVLVYAFPSVPDGDGNPTVVRLGALHVSKNGSLSQIVEVTSSSTAGGNPLVISQFPIIIKQNPCKKHEYILVLGPSDLVIGTFTPTTNNFLQTWKLNTKKRTLKMTGSLTLNQTALGFDINYALDTVAVKVREADSDDLSILQIAQAPTANVEDKYNELRFYKFNVKAKHDALEFLFSAKMNTRGARVIWSHDDKKLAYTQTPYSFAVDQNNLFVDFGLPPGTVSTLSYLKEELQVEWEDTKPTSPLPFALGWSHNDSLIAVAGVPTFNQKDTQLYKVVNTEKKEDESCSESECSDSSSECEHESDKKELVKPEDKKPSKDEKDEKTSSKPSEDKKDEKISPKDRSEPCACANKKNK